MDRLSRRSMTRVFMAMLAFAFLVAGLAKPVSANPWTIDFKNRSGMYIAYKGVPVVWKSTLYVVKPGWLGTLYGEGVQKEFIERLDDGKVIKVKGESDTFLANYTITVVNENTVEVKFEGKLKKNVPCQAEFNMGYFNANLISNAKYVGEKKDGTPFKGKVTVFPKKSGMWESDLVSQFKSFTFDSTLGEFTIDTDAPQRVLFFDARNYTSGWAKEMPLFWGGYNVDPNGMTDSTNFIWSMRLSIKPKRGLTAVKHDEYSVKLDAVISDVVKGYAETGELIVPKPKKMRIGESTVVLGEKVYCTVQRPIGDERLDRATERAVKMFDGVDFVKPVFVKSIDGSVVIRLSGESIKANAFSGKTSAKWYVDNEGYQLTAKKGEGIKIVSSTMRGAFYGLQSAKQLLRVAEDGLELPSIEVTDWPDLEFRGGMFFPATSGYQMDRKLIERVFAPLKLNTVVIELDKIKWDTAPEMAYPDSMSKDQVRELVKLARENFLEPMPLVNVPGHAGWVFNNEQNKGICEDWEAKYAVCTKNPKTMEFVLSIFDEAIEMFDPKVFHMGHDEVLVPGRFPNPECDYCDADDKVEELFMTFMNRCADYLRKKGIRSMVWSDMMLYKGESPDATNAKTQEAADYCRENLPEGVIVGDWHYAAAKEYKSQKIFKEADADVVGCVWATPANIYQMSRDAKATGNLGQLQTMWCGFFPNEATIKAAFNQFEAHVLNAEYTWGDREEKPSELPYAQGDVFNQLYAPKQMALYGGKLIDLSSAGNVKRAAWPMAGTGYNLSVLPREVVNLKGYSFDLSSRELVMLGDSPATPRKAYKSITIDLEPTKAQEIVLLNAGASNVMSGAKLANMAVIYEDGSEAEYELISGKNTSGVVAGKVSTTLNAGWMGRGTEGGRMVMFISDWKNEQPEKAIVQVRFEAGTKQAGWILAGMTIVE
ncbi:family 20 glycosylhydrolase [Planctomycetota bacterium]|nr:family 20 glycosylhydrolase [Planctomycetota bacterium]